MVSFLQNHSLWLAALLLVGLTTGLSFWCVAT